MGWGDWPRSPAMFPAWGVGQSAGWEELGMMLKQVWGGRGLKPGLWV